jgi:hypothetical protein
MRPRSVPFIVLLCLLLPQAASTQPREKELAGRWRVKFTFAGRSEMNLIFESQAKGDGTFLLLDTAPDSKPEASPRSATWTETTNDRVSFSGEVELPIGTCCRETGTLIFKGKFGADKILSGKVIFIASTEEEENPIGFRAMIGTFTASRVVSSK